MANKWLDPLTFPNQEEFQRAYNQYRAKAVAFEELIKFLAYQPKRYETIKAKEKEPKKSYDF